MVLKEITFINLTRATCLVISFASSQLAVHAQWNSGYQPGQNQNSDNTNNFWMNNGGGGSNGFSPSPLANTYSSPVGSLAMPQNPANFMANVGNANVINSGTVLTGVLQEDISSKKSKNADVFSIMLPEDYTVSDRLLIPKYSKFVGSIIAASPAKKARHGDPGNLQVSIQTLVSPDGISIPARAFIDYNPNENAKTDLKKSRGIPLDEWAKSVGHSLLYFGGSLGSRTGVPLNYTGQTKGGKDFSLSKGELLPVRLTEPLDVTPLRAGTTQTASANSVPPSVPSFNQNNSVTVPQNTPSQLNMMPGTSNPAGPEPF